MLIPNARRVLTRAWSVRFIAAAGALNGFEAILPLIVGSSLFSPITTAILTVGISVAAMIARFYAQKDMKGEP